jgi:hypothetical protein
VDCALSAAAFDIAAATVPLDVSHADPVVQTAYANYLTATQMFVDKAGPWAEGCRHSVADGDQFKPIDLLQRQVIEVRMAEAEVLLHNAYHALESLASGG